jgi:hypothetical protein
MTKFNKQYIIKKATKPKEFFSKTKARSAILCASGMNVKKLKELDVFIKQAQSSGVGKKKLKLNDLLRLTDLKCNNIQSFKNTITQNFPNSINAQKLMGGTSLRPLLTMPGSAYNECNTIGLYGHDQPHTNKFTPEVLESFSSLNISNFSNIPHLGVFINSLSSLDPMGAMPSMPSGFEHDICYLCGQKINSVPTSVANQMKIGAVSGGTPFTYGNVFECEHVYPVFEAFISNFLAISPTVRAQYKSSFRNVNPFFSFFEYAPSHLCCNKIKNDTSLKMVSLRPAVMDVDSAITNMLEDLRRGFVTNSYGAQYITPWTGVTAQTRLTIDGAIYGNSDPSRDSKEVPQLSTTFKTPLIQQNQQLPPLNIPSAATQMAGMKAAHVYTHSLQHFENFFPKGFTSSVPSQNYGQHDIIKTRVCCLLDCEKIKIQIFQDSQLGGGGGVTGNQAHAAFCVFTAAHSSQGGGKTIVKKKEKGKINIESHKKQINKNIYKGGSQDEYNIFKQSTSVENEYLYVKDKFYYYIVFTHVWDNLLLKYKSRSDFILSAYYNIAFLCDNVYFQYGQLKFLPDSIIDDVDNTVNNNKVYNFFDKQEGEFIDVFFYYTTDNIQDIQTNGNKYTNLKSTFRINKDSDRDKITKYINDYLNSYIDLACENNLFKNNKDVLKNNIEIFKNQINIKNINIYHERFMFIPINDDLRNNLFSMNIIITAFDLQLYLLKKYEADKEIKKKRNVLKRGKTLNDKFIGSLDKVEEFIKLELLIFGNIFIYRLYKFFIDSEQDKYDFYDLYLFVNMILYNDKYPPIQIEVDHLYSIDEPIFYNEKTFELKDILIGLIYDIENNPNKDEILGNFTTEIQSYDSIILELITLVCNDNSKVEILNNLRNISDGLPFLIEKSKLPKNDGKIYYPSINDKGFYTYKTKEVKCYYYSDLTQKNKWLIYENDDIKILDYLCLDNSVIQIYLDITNILYENTETDDNIYFYNNQTYNESRFKIFSNATKDQTKILVKPINIFFENSIIKNIFSFYDNTIENILNKQKYTQEKKRIFLKFFEKLLLEYIKVKNPNKSIRFEDTIYHIPLQQTHNSRLLYQACNESRKLKDAFEDGTYDVFILVKKIIKFITKKELEKINSYLNFVEGYNETENKFESFESVDKIEIELKQFDKDKDHYCVRFYDKTKNNSKIIIIDKMFSDIIKKFLLETETSINLKTKDIYHGDEIFDNFNTYILHEDYVTNELFSYKSGEGKCITDLHYETIIFLEMMEQKKNYLFPIKFDQDKLKEYALKLKKNLISNEIYKVIQKNVVSIKFIQNYNNKLLDIVNIYRTTFKDTSDSLFNKNIIVNVKLTKQGVGANLKTGFLTGNHNSIGNHKKPFQLHSNTALIFGGSGNKKNKGQKQVKTKKNKYTRGGSKKKYKYHIRSKKSKITKKNKNKNIKKSKMRTRKSNFSL